MTVYQFTVIIEPDEDAYHAYAPVLPGCHTFGSTIEEAQANIKEAIALHVESMQESGELLPIESEPVLVTHLSVSVAV